MIPSKRQNEFKHQNTIIPGPTTDRLLKGWLPRALCSTDTGMPTISVLPRNGDVEIGLALFVLVGT
jgi:hypothetical protein